MMIYRIFPFVTAIQWRVIIDGALPSDLEPVGAPEHGSRVGRYTNQTAQATFSGKYYEWNQAVLKCAFSGTPYEVMDFEVSAIMD